MGVRERRASAALNSTEEEAQNENIDAIALENVEAEEDHNAENVASEEMRKRRRRKRKKKRKTSKMEKKTKFLRIYNNVLVAYMLRCTSEVHLKFALFVIGKMMDKMS